MMPRDQRVPVLIVGAGPAGCALGVLMAERGVPCAVIDRALFPRSKPCGELLNPGAVRALARLGFLEAVLASRPAQIRRWSIHAGGEAPAVGAYDALEPWGLGIARSVLDAQLVAVARARGVRFCEGMTVRRVRQDAAGWVVEARGSGGAPLRWRAAILVGADGLRSIVARQLGVVRCAPRAAKLSLTCHVVGDGPNRTGGYLMRRRGTTLGVAPIHARRSLWNATVVVDTASYARAAACDSMRLFWHVLNAGRLPWSARPAVTGGPWASGAFRLPVVRPVAGTALLIGDAAGYFDPFTGQGIHQALQSAELAAPFVERAWRDRRGGARPLGGYAAALRRHRWSSDVFQRGVEFVLSRDGLREAAIDLLAAAPRYADTVVQVAGDQRPLSALGRIGSLIPSSWSER